MRSASRPRWRAPAREDGTWADWLRELRASSGVYLVREPGGRVLHVGASYRGKLRKVMQRHFQTWESGKTFSRGAVEVRVIPARDGEEARRLRRRVARLHRARSTADAA